MLYRILLIIVVLSGAAGSIEAQERRREARDRDAEAGGLLLGDDVASRLRLAVPPELALFERRPFRDWAAEWAAATRARLARERAQWLRLRPAPEERALEREAAAEQAPVLARSDTVDYLPPLARRDTVRSGEDVLPGVVGQYADLGMRVSGRGELGGQWNRYEPCDPSVHFNCNANLFPQLKPDMLFGVAVGGTISERVHVNVDYDQRREFDGANNINVYYQGLQDEVLQRLEVGDVSIRLPASRFLTRGIPAGNFGLMASGQLGPMDFQAVFAQQRGDVTQKEFQLAGAGEQQGLVQDAQLVLDDAAYVKGQFFYLVEPGRLAGAPWVDVLALRAGDAPSEVRPVAGGTIQLYRDERLSASSGQQNAQLGYFLARGVPPGGGPGHSGTFRRLVPEQDYTIHSSGLWIMLRSPLRADEALAVSYITETGDTIGTYDAERAPAGSTPELRLLRGPVTLHQPGSGTWQMELHQVYRLDSSSQVDVNDIELSISLGEAAGGRTFREVNGRQVSFLRLFGLDEDAPTDRLDLAQIWQPSPGGQQIGEQQPIGGTYIIFPAVEPFLDPAGITSEGLSATQVKAVLGRDANAAIYQEPDPIRRETAGRFRLSFTYRVAVQGLVSSFNLGAFGIREESERIRLGERVLERDVDYSIDYDIGQVSLLDPQTLFATNPGAQLRATWEQKPLFEIAPTSVFGMNTRFRLGTLGELNFVGLYQAEKTLMSRPQLGTEPGSIFLGGTSGRLDFGGALLDRLFGAVPGLRLSGPSNIRLSGELALSTPNPNRRGTAYLDDFEASDELRIEPRRQHWQLGSRPASTVGDRGTLPLALDAGNAAPLVWQHDYLENGEVLGARPPRAIDQQINIAGRQVPEAVMWLNFGPARATSSADPKRWRAITQVLSPAGMDLSRSEYIEFYASAGAGFPLALIFDLGVVGEDAFYVDSLGNTAGRYPDSEQWGLGLLDEEAKLAQREVWGTELDKRGLWDQPCEVDPTVPYPFGDARANCTRGNGLRDTEDLDGDGLLDAEDGQYFRYVVELNSPSEYLVRNEVQTGTNYRLYRIPLRGGNGVPINGASDATWRFVRHLRLTVAGEPGAVQPDAARTLSLARMRIVGSRWSKRDVTGVVRGLLDGEAGLGSGGTEVRVGPVSQVTDGARYRRPPFVGEETQDPQSNLGVGGVEYNEKSLRIGYTDLEPGDRAEAFYHYAQQPRNFLTYRELRLWAVARQGTWGRADGERLLVKLGTDPGNYYLYQTRLKTATGPRPIDELGADWLPELVIDFQPWLELRAEAEQRLVQEGERTSGQDTVWSADSTYAMVYESRARAPNLAAIRELSLAVYNGGLTTTTGEVWLDDLRLGAAEKGAGTAAAVNLDFNAGDFLTAAVGYSRQSDVFRQLNEEPRFVGSGEFSVNADLHLEKLLPASWGLDLPLSVTHNSSAQDPSFLAQSDVVASRLEGLRETGSNLTRVGVRVRKLTPSANPLLSLLVDGTTLRAGYSSASTSAITAKQETGGVDAELSWRRDVGPRTFPAVPGFVGALLRAVAPGRVESSEAFQRMLGSRFRWTPDVLTFTSGYATQQNRAWRYERILDLPGDSTLAPLESPRRTLRNDATLSLQPFAALDATLSLTSDRDLLDPARASEDPQVRAALERARGRLAGLDMGWETSRGLRSDFAYRPVIASWLRVEYSSEGRFGTGRSASYLELSEDAAGDTLVELQRSFENERRTNRRVQLRTADLFAAWWGAPDSVPGLGGRLRRLLGGLEPLELTWTHTLGSAYDREVALPGLGYQLAWGSLDRFRFTAGDTAARAQERRDFRASTAVGLTRSVSVGLTYRTNETTSIDARAGLRAGEERAWPGVRLNVRSLALPWRFREWVPSLSMGAGVERVRRTSIIGTAAQRRGGTSLDVPLSLTASILAGKTPFTLSYTGRLSFGDSFDPTGRAEDATTMHNFSLAGLLPPPGGGSGRLKEPLSVSLTLSQNGQARCRALSGFDDLCTPYLDQDTRSASLRMDTRLSDMRVGAQVDYTARGSYVGTRNGTDQFQLMFFGEFNFSAGQLPASFGAMR